MDNIEKCECVIGAIWNYEGSKLEVFNVEKLKNHIKKQNYYSFDEYFDKQKTTDLTRFNYCPLCGKKIDWKAIKGGANG